MSTKHYSVTTRDVDGRNTRGFATLAAAVRRFEEMVGYSTDAAIAEAFHHMADAGKPLPKIAELRSLRGVSMYGTVVVFEACSEHAIEAATAARAQAEAARVGLAATTAAQRTAATLAAEAAFAEA